MKEKVTYAPVMIPTLCRSTHLIKCVESLRRNTWAKYTDVYIALDYPGKEEHEAGYKEICEYLSSDFSEFASFHVIKRTVNYGAIKNVKEIRTEIFKQYDRYIYAEDDIEFAPCFLEYMNKCLMLYEDHKDVICVTGYSYPVNWQVDHTCNIFKSNLIFPMWGTGFWRDKFKEVSEQIEGGFVKNMFRRDPKSVNIKEMTQAAYIDYVGSALSWGGRPHIICQRCSA